AMQPNNTTIKANPTAVTTTGRVILRLKTISLKVTALEVPVVMPLNGSIKTIPTSAPSNDSSKDSNTNEVKMLGFENPITRSVAIARPRYSTVGYVVLIASKLEPLAVIIATIYTIILICARDEVIFADNS